MLTPLSYQKPEDRAIYFLLTLNRKAFYQNNRLYCTIFNKMQFDGYIWYPFSLNFSESQTNRI